MNNGSREQTLKVMALMACGLGICLAQANPLYDTTKAGHNIKRVILYDYTVTGGHGVNRAVCRLSMRRLAQKYGFQLDTANVSSYITAANLASAQVLITAFGDGDVFNSTGAKTAATNFVERDGKGLLMINAAGAFVPCPTLTSSTATSGGENIDGASCQFLARIAVRQYYNKDVNARVRVYVDSVIPGQVPGTGVAAKVNCTTGGYGATIPPQTTDRSHGIKNAETRGIFLDISKSNAPRFPRVWTGFRDEVYTFRAATYWPVRSTAARTYTGFIEGTTGYSSWEGPVNVLMSIDEWAYQSSDTAALGSTNPVCPVLGDHPISWTRKMGKGLAAINYLGRSAPSDGGVDAYLEQDSVLEKFNWNLLRYLAGDFAGCMDPNYAEYNPEATVSLLSGKDSANWAAYKTANPAAVANPPACKIRTTAIGFAKKHSVFEITSVKNSIHVSIPEAGIYQIVVSEVNGGQVYAKSASGGLNRKIDISGLGMGTYFVRVNTPKNGLITKRISIY